MLIPPRCRDENDPERVLAMAVFFLISCIIDAAKAFFFEFVFLVCSLDTVPRNLVFGGHLQPSLKISDQVDHMFKKLGQEWIRRIRICSELDWSRAFVHVPEKKMVPIKIQRDELDL